jgi:segregation and condensation protein A
VNLGDIMSIPVKLEAFDGPLDLLLKLIEVNKIDIFDIPIDEITDQYMEYINTMQSENVMDDMSEFLVMAAELLYIKSRMLLPAEKKEDEEEPVDPRTELVERLLEYKMYKYASEELKAQEEDAERVVFKEPSVPEEIKAYEEPIDVGALLNGVTLKGLQDIFYEVMKKQADKIDPVRSKFGEIRKEPITVEERIEYIDKYARAHKRFSFRNLLNGYTGKLNVIVTFLGILELMKMGVLHADQSEIFGDIDLVLVQ